VPGFGIWSEDQMTHGLPRLMWLNLAPAAVKSRRRGTTIGVPQVVLNYARVSREVWRLKAMIDVEGHAANSNFSIAARVRAGCH